MREADVVPALRDLGFSEADASTLADHFLDAERRGKPSHGLARIDWLETLDYTRHRVTLNNHSAALEADGTVKVIVAARDPGHPNWLDSAGHARGTIGARWVGKGVAEVIPSARVVRLPEARLA